MGTGFCHGGGGVESNDRGVDSGDARTCPWGEAACVGDGPLKNSPSSMIITLVGDAVWMEPPAVQGKRQVERVTNGKGSIAHAPLAMDLGVRLARESSSLCISLDSKSVDTELASVTSDPLSRSNPVK